MPASWPKEEGKVTASVNNPVPAGFDALPVLDLSNPNFIVEGNRILAELRAKGPVCRVEPLGRLGFLRWADCDSILRDFKTFSVEFEHGEPVPRAEEETKIDTLLREDPPKHTRVRALMQQAFTPQRVAAMEPHTRDIADLGFKDRRPWNEGRKLGAKRPLKQQQVWAIRFWLDREQRMRDRALFDLAIDSKLRGCDVVKVKICDLVIGGRVPSRAIVVQQKTGRPVQFELLEPARSSMVAWLERRGGTLDDFVFPSRIDHADHVSTRQYARLVDDWVTAIGLRREEYGTHSLRRIKASIINKQTGNLRAVQIPLGHTKIESTIRYLGVDVEDALALAERTDV
jgi:integrase